MKSNGAYDEFTDRSKESLLHSSCSEIYQEEKSSCCMCFSSLNDKLTGLCIDLKDFASKAVQMGRTDPRKIIYAIKTGLAMVLVSLLIFWKEPSLDISQYSIWAILTVIVMFEFSIGATFIKGFNRGLGTVCAGILAYVFAELALLAGRWEKVVIVISIFMIASSASYLKLYPTMAPYEYGYRVFVLTYCILIVAGNRTREYNEAILLRLLLIALGAGICFVINISVYPIWAGEDLHHLVVKNFKDLATSLEGCVKGYVKCAEYEKIPADILTYQATDETVYNGYRSLVESTSREQTLLGFAIWEPPHGRYRMLSYPWRNFIKLNGALRHCAYMVMALHGCILSEIQAPPEKRQVFLNELQMAGSEGAKVLRELGDKLSKMEKLSPYDDILKQVHEAAEQLQKKIDHKSYLLVNSRSWRIGKRQREQEDLENNILNEEEYEEMKLELRFHSETAIDMRSLQTSLHQLQKNDSLKLALRKQTHWPSRLSLNGDPVLKYAEMEIYESASSLSLATFASLLIEFVARLQNVVDSFEELSEKAQFKETISVLVATKEPDRLWTRFLRCFKFK